MVSSHLPVIVILIPFLTAYLMPVIGWRDKKFCNPVALVATALLFCTSLILAKSVLDSGFMHYYMGGVMPPWGIELNVDYLGAYMCVVISFITLVVTLYSKEYIALDLPETKIGSYYTLLMLMTGGMIGVSITGDLFNLFVWFEILGISSYILVAISGKREAVLAGYKYLLMGAIGSSLMLVGIAHLYISTGTLNMADMAARLPSVYGMMMSSWTILASLALLITGLSIKTALFPLHTWLPDAHSRAPSPMSAILSGLVIKAGAVAIIRVLFTVFSPLFVIETMQVTLLISWMAALAIIVGSLFAIAQTEIKRMLAYSSVTQIGYVMLGVGVATQRSLTGGLLHIVNHAFTKGALFLCAGAIIYKTGLKNIHDFGGLGKKMPVTMAVFALAAFSMVGVPPTNGFISKFYLAWGAVNAGKWIFAVIILLSSLLNAVYYIRVVNIAYFGGLGGYDELKTDEAPLTMLIPIIILGSGCLLLGIGAMVPLKIVVPAAKSLLGI